MLVKLDDAQVMPGSDLKKLKDAALLKTGFAIVIVGTELFYGYILTDRFRHCHALFVSFHSLIPRCCPLLLSIASTLAGNHSHQSL